MSNKHHQWQMDAENLQLRRRLREAALLEAMASPGRCRRQLLAMTSARAKRDTAHDDPSVTSVSVESRTVDSAKVKFNSSNNNTTNTTNSIDDHDNDIRGIFTVSSVESRPDDSSIVNINASDTSSDTTENTTNAYADKFSDLIPPPVVVYNHNTPTDYRSDMLTITGTFIMDNSSDENRESPEHSTSNSPTSLVSVSNNKVVSFSYPLSKEYLQSETNAPDLPLGTRCVDSLILKPRKYVVGGVSSEEKEDDVVVVSNDIQLNNLVSTARVVLNNGRVMDGCRNIKNPPTKLTSCTHESELRAWKLTAIKTEINELRASKTEALKEVTKLRSEVTLLKSSTTKSLEDAHENELKLLASRAEVLEEVEQLRSEVTSMKSSAVESLKSLNEARDNELKLLASRAESMEEVEQLRSEVTSMKSSAVESLKSLNEARDNELKLLASRAEVMEEVEQLRSEVTSLKSSAVESLKSLNEARDNELKLLASKAESMEELSKLRLEVTSLKSNGAESLNKAREIEYKLLASRAEALDEVIKLRLEVSSLKESFEKEKLEWKTAAEQAVLDCIKEIATLTTSNDQLKKENVELQAEVDALQNNMESMLQLAEERHMSDEEARGLHMMLQADINLLESKLKENKSSIDEKDIELEAMREQLTDLSTKLELQTCELKEESIAHAASNAKLDAIRRENQIMSEQLESQSAMLQELTTEITSISDKACLEQTLLNDKMDAMSQELSDMSMLKTKSDESIQTAAATIKSLQEELARITCGESIASDDYIGVVKGVADGNDTDEVQTANASYEDILSQLESNRNEFDKNKVALHQACQEVIELQSELNEWRQSSEEASAANRVLSLTLEGVQGQVEHRDDVIECLKDVIDDLQEKLTAYITSKEQTENIIHSITDGMNQLETRVVDLSEDSTTVLLRTRQLLFAVGEEKSQRSASDSDKLAMESKDREINELMNTIRTGSESIALKNKELSEMGEKVSSLERLCQEKQEIIIDKEAETSFLYGECEQLNQLLDEFEAEFSFMTQAMEDMEQQYDSLYQEKISNLEQESMAFVKEREMLKQDAESKLMLISQLISSNNDILGRLSDLSLSKEEVEQQERIKSDNLARRIVELESELEQLMYKYQSAKVALAEMDEIWMVRSNMTFILCSDIFSLPSSYIVSIVVRWSKHRAVGMDRFLPSRKIYY
jgi:chromosome segregation ATPase